MARADEDELKKVAHMVDWVAARIREIRESRGWSQAKLGVEMNIATTRIGDFERGCPSWEIQKKGKKPL